LFYFSLLLNEFSRFAGFADPANPVDNGFILFEGSWQLRPDLDLNPLFFVIVFVTIEREVT